MFFGLALIGSFRWSLFSKVEPIFTSLFAVWFIHEHLSPHQYFGIAIVIGSLITFSLFEQWAKIKASR
jgi:drug/metabolite transporter (DMT)-like permease